MKLLAIPLFELYDNAARCVRQVCIRSRTCSRTNSGADMDPSYPQSHIFSRGALEHQRLGTDSDANIIQVQFYLSVNVRVILLPFGSMILVVFSCCHRKEASC